MIEGALALSNVIPRAKGALPRLAGRLLGERLWQNDIGNGLDLLWDGRVLDMCAHVARTGTWEAHILAALRQEIAALPSGSTFYDVGANAGYISLVMAREFENLGHILAFEPLPRLAQALAQSIEHNGLGDRVDVFAVALGNKHAEVDLYLPRHAVQASLVAREADATKLVVPARRLDDLVAEASLAPPDIIKIDIEGAELQFFEGARQTLTATKPVLIFECDRNAQRFGHDIGDVIEFLRPLGYDKWTALADGGPIPMSPDQPAEANDYLAKASI
ncbi:FkbM family methyltransferase [Sphingomicrobium marinum]|uniref:FkbM family methyltransferase n=1 Tax=Sphingomicrobium marinum TaxID=1227950 RepID=UPI00223F73CC|nr:FkbM family methyltransferase [Sphingomicrobium marinum]